jgi:hypothetical protein
VACPQASAQTIRLLPSFTLSPAIVTGTLASSIPPDIDFIVPDSRSVRIYVSVQN